jgi:hypothetical protein
VREDYSESGNAWDYFSHDQARSRAYRWGEDGLAGFSDDKQRICFAIALWNEKDPVLKERLFGLTNNEGNHGEDVKEYYFYLDSTPTHSYMKYLYKYPQSAYPYEDLVRINRQRTRHDFEYELLDTGVFDRNEYFDVFVEYFKESPEDILIKITVCNRGTETAPVHLLPTVWFRNTWSWSNNPARPSLAKVKSNNGSSAIAVAHPDLGELFLHCEGSVPLLFTENETNTERLFRTPNRTPYVKDGINNFVVNGQEQAVNPEHTGTKAAAHYQLNVVGGQSETIRLRLNRISSSLKKGNGHNPFGKHFETVVTTRQKEADEFYNSIMPPSVGIDERNVMRQALSGMLWSKQYYYFDLDRWLEEHGGHPLIGVKCPEIRNRNWFHMLNDDIISMPDKWEYRLEAASPSQTRAASDDWSSG